MTGTRTLPKRGMLVRVAIACVIVLLMLGAAIRRAHESPELRLQTPAGASALAEQSVEAAREVPASARIPGMAVRFEPLPPDPTEFVVRFVTGAPEVELQDLQAFALEMEENDEYREHFDDVEAELRTRGRALAPDAEGRAHVPLPRKWVLVGARSGELFGAGPFHASDESPGEVELVPSHACRVRTRSVAGGPVAGVAITLSEAHAILWRSKTDSGGELVIPNLEWLLADDGHLDCPHFVATDDIAKNPEVRRYEPRAEIPRLIEFFLPPASTLRLSVVAADGTPLAVQGTVSTSQGGGKVRLGRRPVPDLELHDGVVLVPRVAPGVWMSACADLDGGGYASVEVRAPDMLGALEIPLRLPPDQQALLVRVVDAEGVGLANRTLQWQTFAEEPGKTERFDPRSDSLHTDEYGRGVLVVRRPEPDDDEEPVRLRRGRLRLQEQEVPFESRVIRFEDLGSGCVRDLGELRLARAPLIAAGRVHDEAGRPLAQAEVELRSVRSEDGEEEFDDLPDVAPTHTGADGRFAIFGTCSRETVRAFAERSGYACPAGEKGFDFACGTAPELDITLVRTGTVKWSVIADAELPVDYVWTLEGVRGDDNRIRCGAGPGEIVREAELLPGLYRVRLCAQDSGAQPIVDVPDVLVRPGERTLDPRLLGIALHAEARVPEPRTEPEPPIVLQIVDESGSSIPDGIWITGGGCSSSESEFHCGLCRVPAELAGRAIGIWAPGRRFLELDCPERDGEIVLQPALWVRVHFDVPARLRAPGLELYVGLHGSPLVLERLGWGSNLDAQGDALLECPRQGRYELTLSAEPIAESGLVGESPELELEERPSFEVADEPGEQRFAPAIPAEAWAGLARALGLVH